MNDNYKDDKDKKEKKSKVKDSDFLDPLGSRFKIDSNILNQNTGMEEKFHNESKKIIAKPLRANEQQKDLDPLAHLEDIKDLDNESEKSKLLQNDFYEEKEIKPVQIAKAERSVKKQQSELYIIENIAEQGKKVFDKPMEISDTFVQENIEKKEPVILNKRTNIKKEKKEDEDEILNTIVELTESKDDLSNEHEVILSYDIHDKSVDFTGKTTESGISKKKQENSVSIEQINIVPDEATLKNRIAQFNTQDLSDSAEIKKVFDVSEFNKESHHNHAVNNMKSVKNRGINKTQIEEIKEQEHGNNLFKMILLISLGFLVITILVSMYVFNVYLM